MPSYPSFDGFSLQDKNINGIVTSNVKKYSSPARSIFMEKIARRPGSVILSEEFGEKRVRIDGYFLADSEADLQDKIDTFNANVTRKSEGILSLSSNRQATATVENFRTVENPYNVDYVPFSLEMLLADPFFYANQSNVEVTLASGTDQFTYALTISGSYFASPLFTITPPAGTGDTTVQRIDIKYDTTGETIVWSGASGEETLSYGNVLQFDFGAQKIIRDSSLQDTSGAFADIDPGGRNITVTFSGAGTWPGGTLGIDYSPRFL